MGSIVTKRLLVSCALIVGFVSACGSDDPPGGNPPDEGPVKPLVCTSDAECDAEKPFCDPFSGCAQCLFDTQCGEGSHCVDRECVVPIDCISSDECDAENPICNPIVGECVGCVSTDDCGEEALCLAGRCTDVTQCVNSLDCPDDSVCERELGYCVQCVGDADCGEEAACVENACILRCDSDNDCRSGGLLCDAAAGHCVECVEQTDCPDVYNCRSGRCVVDECLQGTSACIEGSNSVSTCNETGSGTEITPCSFDATCTILGGVGATCMPWVCTPGATSCTGDGSQLRVCADDGLSQMTAADCAAEGGICENGACSEVVCTAGEAYCNDGVAYQCAASGTSFTVIEACTETEYCNEGHCSVQICTPGNKTCVGTEQHECNSEGSGYIVSDCADDEEVCSNGECVAKVCEPGEQSCNAEQTAVYVCDSVGAGLVLSTTCSSNYYCNAEEAQCRIRECTPGTVLCDGEVATVCNELGTGAEPDGTDCAALDNQACYGGACLPRLCDADADNFCKDGNSYECTANGTHEVLDDSCSSSQFCNEGTGRCQYDECDEDSVACIDNTPSVCKPDGSGFEPGTPCDDDEVCVNGTTCLPKICEANTYYCEGQVIYDCGSDGTTTTLVTTCAETSYCEEGYSYCQVDECVAGEPVCNGVQLSTCASNGSGPVDAGTACASGKICEDGACKNVVCEAAQTFCDGNTLNLCNDLGTAIEGSSICSDLEFCDDTFPADCVPDICEAGEDACDGETLATCKNNGGGYNNLSTNCADSGKVCNRTACVDAANDTVGGDTSSASSSSYRYANRYYATSDRVLTEIQQYFSVSGTSQFTWFVYEGTSSSSFTKTFESLNTSSGTAVFHSSGTISVPLVKGRYYMIGVRVIGSATRFYTTEDGEWVSFGQQTGSDYVSTTSTLPTSWSVASDGYAYYQKLTTELP